jgi:hypothetical protein
VNLRKARHAKYRAPETGSISSLSSSLLTCAESELRDALADRRPGKAHTGDNHWSPHSVGSILLLIAGFEAWLNESTLLLAPRCGCLREKANLPLRDKYREIPEAVTGKSPGVSRDLALLLTVRNEIAHFLPIIVEHNVPGWLSELQSRGLFLTSATRKPDYDFATKLGSYALAYWAWETVSRAVADFLEALRPLGPEASVPPDPTIKGLGLSAQNFEGFRSLCHPNRLAEYDASAATPRGPQR